jgi:hypothetical protein
MLYDLLILAAFAVGPSLAFFLAFSAWLNEERDSNEDALYDWIVSRYR